MSRPIEFFYPGTHRDFRGKTVTVTRSDVSSAVAAFNRDKRELPLVIGHPDTEDDCVGMGTKLDLRGDRVVITEVRDVDPTFRKIVNSGEMPRVSAKLRLPGHPLNQSSGIEFVHVGFFGKSRVALSDLREASFAHFDREFLFMEDLDRELTEREARIAAREAAFARKERVTPRVQAWVVEGKILPRQAAGTIALLAAMPEDLEVSFAAGDESVSQSGSAFLIDLIDGLPKQVSYGEVAAKPETDADNKTANFAAPKGYVVDPRSLDDYGRVLQYCKVNGLDPAKDFERAAIALFG